MSIPMFQHGRTSEKRFLLTKGEAPNFEGFVNPILKIYRKNMQKYGGNIKK